MFGEKDGEVCLVWSCVVMMVRGNEVRSHWGEMGETQGSGNLMRFGTSSESESHNFRNICDWSTAIIEVR